MVTNERRGDPSCKHCRGWGCVTCLSPLPAGKTCAGCVHAHRCTTIFGQKPTDTACQFIPSRWLVRAAVST
jgi:hypothetical protein